MTKNQQRESRIKAVMENGITPSHTPRPWTLDEQTGTIHTDGLNVAAIFARTSTCKADGKVTGERFIPSNEGVANGRLIVMSPDLFRIAALVARFAAEGASTISLSALMDDSDTETLGQAAIAAINKVRP